MQSYRQIARELIGASHAKKLCTNNQPSINNNPNKINFITSFVGVASLALLSFVGYQAIRVQIITIQSKERRDKIYANSNKDELSSNTPKP